MIANESVCREIITHAVCGKGTKFSKETFTLQPEHPPTTIGGCWVMNHQYRGVLEDKMIEIQGHFALNLWYSFNENTETAVAKDVVHYTLQVPIHELDPECIFEDAYVDVRMVQDPNCVDAVLDPATDQVVVTVEMGHQAELIGKTKLWVMVCDPHPKKESFSDFSESFLEESSREESSSLTR